MMDPHLLTSLSEPRLREIENRGLLGAASRAGLERVVVRSLEGERPGFVCRRSWR